MMRRDCFRVLDKFLREDVGEPCCLAEYLWEGDLYNSQCYRAIFEAANKARPRNAGTHLWKVNAAWPSMMWQVFDWYLRPNAGYYSMKSACRPLHVQASADDWTVQVVSTLPQPQPGLKVRMTVTDSEGKPQAAREVRPLGGGRRNHARRAAAGSRQGRPAALHRPGAPWS